MILKYLLDTNIISEPIRPIPNANVVNKINIHKLEIAVSTVTIHELLYGCLRLPASRKSQVLNKYIQESVSSLPILDYDLKSAQYHAQERARLSKIGKIPAYADGQIASIAFSNNLILVTNNVDDFQYFDGLIIENWFNSSINQ
jgi:tRNA(fMet)-specific endonuclease VapC